MRSFTALTFVLCAGVGLAACRDSDKALKTPTQPTDSVTAIEVVPLGNVGIGQETRFRATATLANGQTSNITDIATWQSSDTSIVRLEPRGVAIGVMDGSATVSAAYQGVTGSRNVTTFRCTLWDIRGPTVIWLDQSVWWETNAYDGCIPHWTSVSAQWQSMAPAVLTMEPPRFGTASSVRVTGRSPGTAIIAATLVNSGALQEKTGTVTVLSFRRPPPEVIRIDGAYWGLAAGKTIELLAGASWRNPISWYENVTLGAEWRSSDRTVATVSQTGHLTGRKPGTTIVSATFDGVRGDADVFVGGDRDAVTVTKAQIRLLVFGSGEEQLSADVDFTYTLVSSSGSIGLTLRDQATNTRLGSAGDPAVTGARSGHLGYGITPLSKAVTTVCGTLELLSHDGIKPNVVASADIGCFRVR